MRWSKIKNIIILLLIVVNGFLLAQVGLRTWRSRRDERETRERMVAILERNDIAFLPGEVPGELELTERRVTVSAPGQAEAAALVGEAAVRETVGARVTYEGLMGRVVCSSSGEIEARFNSGAVPEARGEELLEALGLQVRETGRETGFGSTVVTYIQLWDGAPVPGLTVRLTLWDGCIESLSLHRLAGTEEELPGEETITAVTALTRLLDELNRGEGYVCSQVTDMYPGYTHSGTGTVTLTPAWFVETDTWRFVVDGYTGAITATR